MKNNFGFFFFFLLKIFIQFFFGKFQENFSIFFKTDFQRKIRKIIKSKQLQLFMNTLKVRKSKKGKNEYEPLFHSNPLEK